MNMPGMSSMNAAEAFLLSQASGTSMNPRAWSMPMIETSSGGWQFLFMGTAFVVDTQQSGPRGADKLYSPNWGMFEAVHRVGRGAFLFQLMPSLEPLTIANRRYPELFQTGETAYGKPLVDAQHPHNLIMAAGFQYAYPISETTTLQAYFAPVGDPALGPVAFPHRASAAELPQAPLGHHWQDSTHIADEVVTAAVAHRWIRLEASGFHGAEPDENRWHIEAGALDSWSARLSVFPSDNWMAQVSAGRLTHPEALQPGDVLRSTASLHYSKPVPAGDWSTSVIWGRNHDTFDHRDTNSYLLESVFPLTRRNLLTGRIELVDKDELYVGPPGSSYRIAAYTAGYTRDVQIFQHVETGIGANVSTYGVPQAIVPYYSAHPFAVNMYLRMRLRSALK